MSISIHNFKIINYCNLIGRVLFMLIGIHIIHFEENIEELLCFGLQLTYSC